jgi:glycyl-tRNA synthetase
MNNIISVWREHFILEEDMLEVSCSNITPESVLKASGHKDRFTDLMVKDTKNASAYRADKLLIEQLEKKMDKEKKTLTQESVS